MKNSATIAIVIVLCLAFTGSAWAMLSDNFDSENGGSGQLNYNSFTNWDVVSGNIDLIGNGFYDLNPNGGLYVDMDGSSDSAGKIVSKTSFSFMAGGNYVLQFDLSGAYTPDNEPPDSVIVQVGDGSLFDETFSMGTWDDWTTYTRSFHVDTATSAKVSFTGTGSDMRGMLLDNVSLTYVPAPGAIVLGGLGAGLVGWLRRRRTL